MVAIRGGYRLARGCGTYTKLSLSSALKASSIFFWRLCVCVVLSSFIFVVFVLFLFPCSRWSFVLVVVVVVVVVGV